MRPLEELDDVRWHDFGGPQYYEPAEVPRSLLAASAAVDVDSSNDAYNRCLFAFGNNHAGTLYPAAVAAVPFLTWLVAHGTIWARWTALEILCEAVLFGYEPEGATARVDGFLLPIDVAVRRAVESDADTLFAVMCDPGAPDSMRDDALTILDTLGGHEDRLREILSSEFISPQERVSLPGLLEHRNRFAKSRHEWLSEHMRNSGNRERWRSSGARTRGHQRRR